MTGCPIGLGSHAQWDRKLDARLAAGGDEHPGDQGRRDRPGDRGRPPAGLAGDGPDPLTSPTIPPTTAGSASAARPTTPAASRAARPTASRSSSAPPRSRSARWPRAGPSVNMATKAPQPAAYERSDVCAVPGRQRDRRERRRLRDRRRGGREVRRHQPRGHPGRPRRPARAEPPAAGRVGRVRVSIVPHHVESSSSPWLAGIDDRQPFDAGHERPRLISARKRRRSRS